ncbi:MAG: M16 family metallopeptidase [Gemmatimonadota bacterium]
MSFDAGRRPALLLALCASLLVPVPGVSQEIPADAAARAAASTDPLPRDPAVRTGRLENGLRYFVRANGRPENRAELRLVVNAGSVLEDPDQLGLAHFVEHMAFNGTVHFQKQELVDWLESIGMRFGADINAFTNFDETVYQLEIPTDEEAVTETALQILEDWAHGQVFDRDQIDQERGVVIEEWRLGQGAGARMRDRQFPILFRGSRYADRLPIGSREVLESFDPAALERFYRDWYRPDLMAVIAVGDFDPADVERRIKERFRALPEPAHPRPRPVFEVPGHDETLFAIATDPEASQSSVSLVEKLPVEPIGTHEDYRRTLVEDLYNGMLNRRLFEITQRPGAPFVAASSSKGRFVRAREAYVLGAAVRDGGIEEGLRALLEEAKRVSRHGFTRAELERQKTATLRGLESAYDEREKTHSAAYAGEYLRAFLQDEPFPGIAYEFALARRYLPGIGLAEVNEVARDWLRERDRVVLVNAPEKEGVAVPDEEALRGVLEAVRGRAVAAWADSASDRPLVPNPPAPGHVVAESRVEEIGLTEWRLDNGVRVFLKPTDFKEDQILMQAWSPGGTSLVPDSLYTPAAWATPSVGVGGLGDFSLIDLGKKLTGKVAFAQTSIGDLEEGISGQASPKDLETLFEIIYLEFTAPRRDAGAYAAMLERFRAALENRGADPDVVFRDSLTVTLAQHHVRRRPMTIERLGELDLDASLRVYRDRFADASDFTFLFVGSFDLEAMRPLVERWLGGLPSLGRQESWRDVGVSPPDTVVRRTIVKGAEPKARTAIVFTGPFEYTRENRYLLGSLAEALRITLRESLREELGGTYGVAVGAEAVRRPTPGYSLTIEFGADPDRLSELTRATFALLEHLKGHGPPPETVTKVREIQRRARETGLERNGFWLGRIAAALRDGEDPRLILAYDGLVEGLTAKAIAAAALRWLREDRFVQVSLVPESSSAD